MTDTCFSVSDFKELPVIDSHVHLSFPYPVRQSEEFYRIIAQQRHYDGMVFVAYTESASKGRDETANKKALYYKSRFPGSYASAGLLHLGGETAEDFLAQAKLYRAQGFDGMKMLEGKPDLYKHYGIRVDDPVYDRFYAYLEENAIPLTMHVADPASFWDADKVSDYAKKVGWFYGDGTYPTREELFSQVWNVMERFPALRLNLAHFGNMHDIPGKCEEFLTRWKNTCFDLTPGGSMFTSFSADPVYWKDFFIRFRTRILFGTDTYNLPEDHSNPGGPAGRWALVRSFLEGTSDYRWGTVEGELHPFGFGEDILRLLYRENALALFGASPRPVDAELARLETLDLDAESGIH